MLSNGLALAAFGELGEVFASAEHLAGTGDDDGADVLVGLRVVHDVFHGLRSSAVEGVSDVRAIDANDEQAILAQLGYDGVSAKVICHDFLLV